MCSSALTCGDGSSATSATFGAANYTAVDKSGNLYISDYSAESIRFVYAGGNAPAALSGLNGSIVTPTPSQEPTPGFIYTVAGTQFAACGTAPCGDGGLALSAQLNNPNWVTADDSGNIYVADTGDNTIRKIDSPGYISNIAGTESPSGPLPLGAESGSATSVTFNGPVEFTFDSANNLYPADYGNALIWEALPLQPQTISFNTLAPVTYGAGAGYSAGCKQ